MTLLKPELLPSDSYPFARWRRMLESGLQEGVVDAGDFKVTQRAAGANMSVDVAAGRAWVRGDDTARQGLYHDENDATVNTAVTAANATNPRVDQVILRIYDTSVIGGGTNAATVEVLAGTPTAGATLDNRNGAAALPATAIRLADILVPAASASVTTANIRDRRPWARGAYRALTKTDANVTAAAGVTTGAVAGLAPRLELSGAPVLVTLTTRISLSGNTGFGIVELYVDGAVLAPQRRLVVQPGGANFDDGMRSVVWEWTPTAGSRLLDVRLSAVTTGATLNASASSPATLIVEERIRQNADNS